MARPSKYNLNEEYFKSIDSPPKAYFLGLLSGDGHNNPKRGRTTISLVEEDKYILEEFKKELAYSGPIPIRDNKNGIKRLAVLEVCRKSLSSDLEKLGVTLNKSKELELPKVDELLVSHLIRGLLDSDGYISKKESNSEYETGIVSTHEVCRSLKEYCLSELGINSYVYRAKEYTSKFRIIGHHKIKKFLDWIYSESTASTRLLRKYTKYLEFLERYHSIHGPDNK